jgi:hypothetical protein
MCGPHRVAPCLSPSRQRGSGKNKFVEATLGMSNWKTLYSRLFISHPSMIKDEDIQEAERAILLRGKELMHATDPHSVEEHEPLVDALYTLDTLKQALEVSRIGRLYIQTVSEWLDLASGFSQLPRKDFA